jgi:hypothetical protein
VVEPQQKVTDRSEPPTWLIVTGIVVALGLIFLLGLGYGQRWGANQWGPVAAWLSGALTLAAVVAALHQSRIAQRQAVIAQQQADETHREAMRLQEDRLIDHEVSRRRECIQAISDLWAALVGMSFEFTSFTDYLVNLPTSFNGALTRDDGLPPERPGEPFINEIGRHFETFYASWFRAIQPPLFVALAVLYGTDMYDAVDGINGDIAKISKEETEGGLVDVRKALMPDPQHGLCHRPDIDRLTAMWQDIVGRRFAHLRLVQEHFSLKHEDVENAVLGRSPRDQR